MFTSIAKWVCEINGLLHKGKYKYSQSTEGNFAYMNLRDKLWWGYKFFVHPIEKGEKDKHIEEYFKNQDLTFHLPKDFKITDAIDFTAGGDLLPSKYICPDNTLHLWDDIKDFFFQADITCANLETPVVTTKSASFVPKNILTVPALNNTPKMFDKFYCDGKGIRFFSTANNHCLDMGESGLCETLDFLDSKGCAHVGTSRSIAEREDIPVIEKRGIRIAFLSYTFSTNGRNPSPGKEHLVNYIRLNKPDCDISMIKRHIYTAKVEKSADIVVTCLHWSLEFESYPVENVIKMGHRLMKCGIDIIIGNHPHVIQPMEKYPFVDPFSNELKEGLIIYALGDLVSYQELASNSMVGNIVKLKIAKGKINEKWIAKIADLKIKPIYHYVKVNNNHCFDFRLLDFVKLTNNLKTGNNYFEFNSKAIKEIYRLEKLTSNILHKKIMS